MLPHDGVGGFTPTPRMASVPSATIATATPSSAIENIAGRTFGSTSRTMIRCSSHPGRGREHELALRPVSALARVIRPSSGIDTMPIARIRSHLRVVQEATLPAETLLVALEECDERRARARSPGPTSIR